MNIEHIFLIFWIVGMLSTFTLLVIPEIKYSMKVILIFWVCTLWIYMSINFLTVNYIYITHDSTGIFLLISATVGILASISASAVVVSFLNEKKHKSLDMK